jgi:hypothetical protein
MAFNIGFGLGWNKSRKRSQPMHESFTLPGQIHILLLSLPIHIIFQLVQCFHENSHQQFSKEHPDFHLWTGCHHWSPFDDASGFLS